MKQPSHGSITLLGLSHTKGFSSFVERKVRDWLIEQNNSKEPAQWRFNAEFSHDELGNFVKCDLEVDSESRSWFGSCVSEGPQRALKQSLTQMQIQADSKSVHAL